MKHIPRLLLAYLAGIVAYLTVTYLFDGDAMDWKRTLVQAAVVGPFPIALVFYLGKRKD